MFKASKTDKENTKSSLATKNMMKFSFSLFIAVIWTMNGKIEWKPTMFTNQTNLLISL